MAWNAHLLPATWPCPVARWRRRIPGQERDRRSWVRILCGSVALWLRLPEACNKVSLGVRDSNPSASMCGCASKFHHGCAGETGERRGRESLTMNGVASPIGPESCVSHREVWGEALTGVLVGQVLSHVTKTVRDADAFCGAEGSTVRRVIASATPVPRGLRPWHVNETFCSGTGRSHGWPSEEGLSASGRLEGRSR
jgi:hypothetical protein